jgi:hypothetical protein
MVASALTAALGAIGTGSISPPSTRTRPLRTTGANRPGSAIEADGDVQRAVLEPHLPLGQQIGRHCGERQRQVLDRHVADQLSDVREDSLGADRRWGGERDVHQPQDVELGQAQRPIGVGVQLPGRVDPADEPAMLTSSKPRSSSTWMAPMCAYPRAPPLPKASETRVGAGTLRS